MEATLKDLLDRHPQAFHHEEVIRSNKIINCAGQMINVKCPEFPAAAIALKCIAKETDLMCELVRNEIRSPSHMSVSSDIRQCALRFMTYKGDHYFAAAATMMGATREAEVMCNVLRKELDDKKGDFTMSHFIRDRSLGAMIKMYYEYPATEEHTSTSGKLVHGESEVNSRERNDTKDQSCWLVWDVILECLGFSSDETPIHKSL
ncbi:hypothetical protein EJB05_35778, partial [Eragrostis curvula]